MILLSVQMYQIFLVIQRTKLPVRFHRWLKHVEESLYSKSAKLSLIQIHLILNAVDTKLQQHQIKCPGWFVELSCFI
jgi:hypothetical protein